GVAAIADVRAIPRSRHVPHFNSDALARDLPRLGIAYLPLPALGGRRHARKDSPNTGWRNAAFRGYADYMQTAEFGAGFDELERAAAERPTAVMCAEAVPWRCHRSLLADALLVRGWRVIDLIGPASVRPHELTKFARVEGGRITYPDPEAGLFP